MAKTKTIILSINGDFLGTFEIKVSCHYENQCDAKGTAYYSEIGAKQIRLPTSDVRL